MRIGFENLDRESAQLLAAQAAAVASKDEHTDEELRALGASRARDQERLDTWTGHYRQTLARSLGWTLGIVCGAAVMTVALLISGHYEWAWLPGTAGGLAGGVAGIRYGRRARHSNHPSDMDTNPLHENLINWLPAVDLPRLERAYFEAVQVLSSEQFPLTPEDTRSILAQLNTLVARYRDLEVRRQALLGVMSEGKYEKTEQERSMLAQRAEAVDDPLAKRALLQSLRLCEDRAANLGKLKPALERLDAQQEAIVQTIASLHATLVRWQAAPALSDLPDVSEIQQSVVRINDETCAVEQAVQEVVTLNM